jgi:hypothetical protein
MSGWRHQSIVLVFSKHDCLDVKFSVPFSMIYNNTSYVFSFLIAICIYIYIYIYLHYSIFFGVFSWTI